MFRKLEWEWVPYDLDNQAQTVLVFPFNDTVLLAVLRKLEGFTSHEILLAKLWATQLGLFPLLVQCPILVHVSNPI